MYRGLLPLGEIGGEIVRSNVLLGLERDWPSRAESVDKVVEPTLVTDRERPKWPNNGRVNRFGSVSEKYWGKRKYSLCNYLLVHSSMICHQSSLLCNIIYT